MCIILSSFDNINPMTKQYANQDVLCETDWVNDNLNNPTIKILKSIMMLKMRIRKVIFQVLIWFGGKRILMTCQPVILLIKLNSKN